MEPSPYNRGPVWVVAFSLLLLSVPFAAGNDLGPVEQDDAGSGRDAPDAVSQDITIEPDVVYHGMSTGPLTDLYDVYHFVGHAGDRFEGWSDGNLGCYYLLDANGNDLGEYACSYAHAPMNTGPISMELPEDADYYIRIVHFVPTLYKFGFSLTSAAPEVRTLAGLFAGDDPASPEPLPVPEGCDNEFVMVQGIAGQIPMFTDGCYHMRTDLNNLDTTAIDVLIVPPVSTYPERDLRVMRQAVEMWSDGIETLAPQMGLGWLSEGVEFQIFVDDDDLSTDPAWDPEIVVVGTNPVGGGGIGVDPIDLLFDGAGPCHGQPNPLAAFEDWEALPGFDSHHGEASGTFVAECEGGGAVCFAVNGAIDPAPGFIDFFGLYDLVAHEVGHCLTIGHVGDALDHKTNATPLADIMSYTRQDHDKCVSTLDVEVFALTMSRFLLETPLGANDGHSAARGSFHIQHPDGHWYASPTGLAEDCPQPDDGIVPGGDVVSVHDDAGSGRDAPDNINQEINVAPDTVYGGTSPGPFIDSYDVYHLVGQEGETFKGWSDGNMGCYHLLDSTGDSIGGFECSYAHAPINTGPLVHVLPYTGDYYFQVVHLAPALYHFGFSLSADAPSVRLMDRL